MSWGVSYNKNTSIATDNPAVCFGPGDIAQAHTADEWVDASEVVLCADTLATFARSLAE